MRPPRTFRSRMVFEPTADLKRLSERFWELHEAAAGLPPKEQAKLKQEAADVLRQWADLAEARDRTERRLRRTSRWDLPEPIAASRRKLTILANTYSLNAFGVKVETAGIDLAAYRRNPVVLLNHDTDSPPIGRGHVRKVDDKLLVDVTFDRRDPRARRIASKYRRGFMHACSIGVAEWTCSLDADGIVVTACSLQEVSLVTEPANGDCVVAPRPT